ncbi:MAG: zinc ABC transporter substrate-binding protein [Verrucomicrobiales bacterium]|nr:zinc ABC transporter substrate-binding protein [Verrucomicrobiales bacterium]MCP5558726.1 zinc ABC transporter substrate-binding protein [Verrucomicrobiaceae bacterium]
MKKLFFTVALLAMAVSASAAVKVATLHPILADLARQVGGDHVDVIEILRPGGDVHHFEPAAKDIGAMRGAALLLASGKGLESFLDKLRDSIGESVKLVEVGRGVPSIMLDPSQEVFACCPAHAKGGIDPHWWHSADAMGRAARIIADEFSAVDPGNADAYKANAKAAARNFDELKSWAKKQISQIPRSDRKLVTAHAAFGYFCKEYGFKSVPVLGIGRSDDVSPQYVMQAINVIRENKIRAVFPEDQANPKVLEEITRSTGAVVGKALVADGTSLAAHTFETMLRHNVECIVEALRPQE